MSLWTAAGGGRGVTYVGVIRVWAWGHSPHHTLQHTGSPILGQLNRQQTINGEILCHRQHLQSWNEKCLSGIFWRKELFPCMYMFHCSSDATAKYVDRKELLKVVDISKVTTFHFSSIRSSMLYLLLSGCHLTVVASRCLHSLLSDSRSRPKYTPCLASRVPLW